MDDTAISRLLPHPGNDCFSLLPTSTAGPGSCSAAFGRGKPLPYGKAEESTGYHRTDQLMGARRLLSGERLHHPGGMQSGSIGGHECVMGPQPEPSVSGSGWERPIPPVRGKWPKAKGGRDEQGSGRSFRRPGGNGAKRTLRGRGAPVDEKTVPSGRPRKIGGPGGWCGD